MRMMVYSTKELTPRTYPDFQELAVRQGSCWCMYYQRPGPIGTKLTTDARNRINRKDKEKLVRRGKSHAILVYDGATQVGWCQYGTQDELPRIDAGRNYRKIGPPAGVKKLWRITCFFVDKNHRSKGVSKAGLSAALKSIEKRGGGIVEAYPVVSEKMAAVPEWRWFGTPGMFEREGFRAVAPLGTSLTLMRKTIPPGHR